jgi:hypothetical protein
MTDIRANDPALDDDDRLPWLEAVEEDDDSDGPGAAKLIAFVVIGLVIIGLVVGGVFWMRSPTAPDAGTTTGEPEVIAAPEGDYKVKPTEPGGMKVEGKGETAYAASKGAEPQGQINTNAVPEAPVVAPPKQVAQAAPPPAPPKQAPAAPAPAPARPAAGGATIQLGAFSSAAGAEKAWKALSGRFSYLAPLSHSVPSATVNGKTVYRLRASGADAKGVCGRLRVAGESCVEVQ